MYPSAYSFGLLNDWRKKRNNEKSKADQRKYTIVPFIDSKTNVSDGRKTEIEVLSYEHTGFNLKESNLMKSMSKNNFIRKMQIRNIKFTTLYKLVLETFVEKRSTCWLNSKSEFIDNESIDIWQIKAPKKPKPFVEDQCTTIVPLTECVKKCTECDGLSRCYQELKIEWRSYKDEELMNPSRCKIPENELNWNLANLVFEDQACQVLSIDCISHPDIGQASEYLINKHKNDLYEHKIIMQSQKIFSIPVKEIDYEYKGKFDKFWIHGKDEKIYMSRDVICGFM